MRLLFFFICCIQFTQAQDCYKAWLHYEHRVQLSKITKDKFGINVPIDKIQIDFLGAPIGIPYQYNNKLYVAAKDTVRIDDNEFYLHKEAYKSLQSMRKAAEKDSLVLQLLSAYRTEKEQLYFYQRFGAKIAEQAGFSEHQLYTAIDIAYVNDHNIKFLWLLKHAFDYGWVPSYYYRVDNTRKKEAWHWRYVGIDAAFKFRCAWEKEIEQDIARLQKHCKL